MARSFGGVSRVIGERGAVELTYSRSHIQRYAIRMTRSPTPAERQLARILNSLNRGVLKRRFRRQHVVSGRWIVDFFFPEVRLAIEVDGSVHGSKKQRALDHEKEKDCARFDMTLLRLTNREVFGDRELLMGRLRDGWRRALRRENKIIGKECPIESAGPNIDWRE